MTNPPDTQANPSEPLEPEPTADPATAADPAPTDPAPTDPAPADPAPTAAVSTAPVGQAYWRSIEEWSNSDEFRQALIGEFPDQDPDQLMGISRRRFMTLAAASMALAGVGLSGCRHWPEEELRPYASRPENDDPGVPQMYASMLERAGVAVPVLVKSYDGRPIKIEGNPGQPENPDVRTYTRGKADVFHQASTLELYDPERSRRPMRVKASAKGSEAKSTSQSTINGDLGPDDDALSLSVWSEVEKFVDKHFTSMQGPKGKSNRMAVLAEPSSSPTVAAQREKFLKQYPGATWYEYKPIDEENRRQGTKQALGKDLRPVYDLTQADVLVSLDADLFSPARGDALRLAYDWAQRRQGVDDKSPNMNRMYVVEPTFTITGSVSDERLAIGRSQLPAVVRKLAGMLGINTGQNGNGGDGGEGAKESPEVAKTKQWLATLAKDLKGAGQGRAVVIPGRAQPAEVHALCWAINDKLGAIGTKPGKQPVHLIDEPTEVDNAGPDALAKLTQRMNAGEIDSLLILGGNPAFDAPHDVPFADAMQKVSASMHLSMYANQTSRACSWALPQAHSLECWADGRSYDGTMCVQQPLIRPLYEDAKRTTGGRSSIELLAMVLGDKQQAGYDVVRAMFAKRWQKSGTAFEKAWRQAIHDGFVPGTEAKAVSVSVNAKALKTDADQNANENASANANAQPNANGQSGDNGNAPQGEYEITLNPDPALYDGRYANNGWLQELPDPMTKLTWDNIARVSVHDARELNLVNANFIQISVDGRQIRIPVYIMPGQPAGTISLTLGHGRTAAGHVGNHVGVDTYPLRTVQNRWTTRGSVNRLAGRTDLATTEIHQMIDPQVVDPEKIGQTDVHAWMRKVRQGGKNESSHQGNIINEATLEHFKENRHFAEKGGELDHSLQLFPGPREGEAAWHDPESDTHAPAAYNEPHAWGMSIDTNACIGCNACVIACQAENNVPVVGKDMVQMSREMHWLRIDTYYKGDPRSNGEGVGPEVVHEPMMCVHCENAPCEQVCPVGATMHDTEGLNVMIYNRCVGVRYCSNNCPYKVRRFNFFDWHAKDSRGMAKPWLNLPDQQTPQLVSQIKRMVFNPDVTVRMRGVMEKCTYCLQRINHAKIQAKNAWAKTKQGVSGYDRDTPLVKDGELETACQQTCPTNAITFGNLNEKDAQVSKDRRNPRSYGVLQELNTRPRSEHMAKIRNPAEETSEV